MNDSRLLAVPGARESGANPLNNSQLAAALAEYVELQESGQSPSRSEFVARFPEIATALDECLRQMDWIGQMAGELSEDLLAGGSAVGSAGAADRPSRVLGDFRILREVGRGGMGVVYEAEQISLRRRVALKILPSAAMLDPRALQRFRNEAQAAASLHHGQIVPIYGVGCERGVHYYAMQFIDGVTLAEVIAALRESAGLAPLYQPDQPVAQARESQRTASHVGRPSQAVCAGVPQDAASDGLGSPSYKKPPSATETDVLAALSTEKSRTSPAWFRRIAEQFAQVAGALHHAHELGVTHRDIKPANLMLDRLGHIWITDFGLARIEGEGNLTMTGDLVGTLRYMSPEQSLAKRIGIDHRTDIYSLGITLYELLTLHPALPGHGRQELLRQIAFEEPKALRKHNAAIPRDLETIVLKMIEKNPAERYQTAMELEADLKRFEEDRHITARRPSLYGRTLKWSRRHANALLAMLCVVSLFAISMAVSSFLILKARNDAVAKGAELQQRHEQAVVILGRVNGIVNSVLERLSSLPAGDATRIAIIEEELTFYNGLQVLDKDNPAAADQLALALHRLGHLQIELMRLKDAEINLRKSIGILERRIREEPNSGFHANSLCHAWMNLGRVQFLNKDNAAAIHSFQELIANGERAMQILPDNSDVRMALAFPWGQLGTVYSGMKRASDAKAAHEKEIELHRQNVASNPNHWQYRLVLGAAMTLYCGTLHALGEHESASKVLESAIDMHKSLSKDRPGDWMINSRLANLYFVRGTQILDSTPLQRQSGLSDAERDYREAIRLDPNHAGSHVNLRRAADGKLPAARLLGADDDIVFG